jgi:hypothetical protein
MARLKDTASVYKFIRWRHRRGMTVVLVLMIKRARKVARLALKAHPQILMHACGYAPAPERRGLVRGAAVAEHP